MDMMSDVLHAALQWTGGHWLEIFGAAGALLYIGLEIGQRSSMWAVGFVSSAVYVAVFFQSGLYAFAVFNVYYLAASVYGMYCWRFVRGRNGSAEGAGRAVCRLKPVQGAVLAAVAGALFVSIGYVLARYAASSTPPYGEALATSLSIVATWMLARKILEHWLLWIVINFFSSGLYYWCGLYPTAVLYAIYGVLSVTGWLQWRRSYNCMPQ